MTADGHTRHPDDRDVCRERIRHGSHSFFMASWLLPRDMAVPATALYAFCRIADDMIDADRGGHAAVARLGARLDAIYSGRPGDAPEDRAFAEVVHRYAIPRAMPDALLEGLAWDAAGRRYDTLSDVYDYAARVAGCVGAMMTLVMRTSDARAIARALDLGVAMQLTNIARDIGEDAAMGRLYLPRDWFRRADMDPDAWLAEPRACAGVRSMTRRLLEYAGVLYRRADAGIALLPASCRPGIRAARLIYADIGREIARGGHDSVSHRAVVPRARKLWLLGRAAGGALTGGRRERQRDALEWPALHETRYLLEDIDAVPHRTRLESLFSLFETLDRRDREALHDLT